MGRKSKVISKKLEVHDKIDTSYKYCKIYLRLSTFDYRLNLGESIPRTEVISIEK